MDAEVSSAGGTTAEAAAASSEDEGAEDPVSNKINPQAEAALKGGMHKTIENGHAGK